MLDKICSVKYDSVISDSSTVPNTASNAKDHGNAPRRFVNLTHSHHTTRATGDESGVIWPSVVGTMYAYEKCCIR